MRIMTRGILTTALVLAIVLGARVAAADNNPNGQSFRAAGWFKGMAEITDTEIKCEIPTLSSAIADGLFAMGIWNTFGRPNLYFPDPNGPFSNPCGGWIQLQNNLIGQSILLDHVNLAFKIPHAGRFRQFVPVRNGFPVACKGLRRDQVFASTLLNPIDSTQDVSGSGAPNVAFVQILPMVSTEMFNCLRAQYAPLPTDLFSSLPLVIRATAVGISDSGDTFKSNSISYTLNLRHTCGNGRLDDLEMCDPTTPFNSCFEECLAGACATTGRACTSSQDCPGTCLTGNSPSECSCIF
jgi:hypothetical protein